MVPAHGGRVDDTSGAAPSAALLIRVWFEPGHARPVRARLLAVREEGEPTTWGYAACGAEITELVDGWLSAVGAEPGRPGRPQDP